MKNFLKALLFIVAILPVAIAYSQNSNLHVQVFKKDTSFTCIALDDADNVFAGTNGKGLYKYDKTNWKKWNLLQPAFSKSYLRQLAIKGNEVWVASSGYVLYMGSGAAGNNNNFYGGAFKLDNNYALKSIYYKGRPVLGQAISGGPPTRYVLGMFIDSSGVPWAAASYQDSVTYPAIVNYNARYHYVPGAVGRFNGQNFDFITGADLPDPTGILLGIGNNYKDDSYSIGKRRVCRSITQVGNEMWVGSDGYDQAAGNLITAGILRYDLSGNYLGKFDENTTGIPFGLTNTSFGPWSLYQDVKGRVWVSMSGFRGIAVRDTNGVWTNVGIPPGFPNTVYRANAIAGNSRGEVFFGTSNGLVVYKGNGSFTSDTSYKLYTTANGLSSNSIAGVAVGKDESIWLATSAGVNKITRGNLQVFNRKPFKTIFTDSDVFRTPVLEYDSKQEQQYIDKDTLLIAADGGKATIFKWTGASPQNVKFRILEDSNGQHPDEYGSFQVRWQDNDSVRALFYHPKFLAETVTIDQNAGHRVRLQVVDTTQNPEVVMIDIPVRFVLPPVLMVHGVWTSIESFAIMEKYLQNASNFYQPFNTLRIWYPNSNHPEPVASQEAYKYEVPQGIDKLIENCALNKMSVGKVDILGHSRGGIFARTYLQERYVGYRNDINKLICLNTPHFGSQTANLALDKRVLPVVKRFGPILYADTTTVGHLFGYFTLDDYDDINGAEELKVNSPAITQDLNGASYLNRNLVYSHNIIGRYLFGQTTFADVVNSGLVQGNFIYRVRIAGMMLSLGITKLDDFMKQIFNGEFNDIVVPESSQGGGLSEDHISRFPGINVAHSTKKLLGGLIPVSLSVLETPEVESRVVALLRQDPKGGSFATDGFKQDSILTYNFLQPNPSFIYGTPKLLDNDFWVRIDSTLDGKNYNAGDTVFIKVGKNNTDTLLMGYSGRSIGVYSDAHFGNDTLFKFPIPKEAFGAVNIEVYGFNNHRLAYDSISIFVNVPPTVVLDSIKILNDDDIISIIEGDSVSVSFDGFYSDSVTRNISYETSLQKQLIIGNAAFGNNNYLKGLIVGQDVLVVNYGGKSDTVYIEVLPKKIYDSLTSVVPVRFTIINAQYNGKTIDVKWATAFEQNNKYFEVEYSTNGSNFTKVGTVTATNNINGSNYNFVHTGFVNGKNYYRIRQVDLDGKTSYSPIAVALVNTSGKIVLYPNPVTEQFTLDFKAAENSKDFKVARIINRLGQVMQQENIIPGVYKKTILVAGLTPGIYNIEIIDKNGKSIWVETFVKYR